MRGNLKKLKRNNPQRNQFIVLNMFEVSEIMSLTLVRPCMVNLPAQNHMDNLILKYII